VQTTARIFDSLLVEGSKILHRVGLAIFKVAARQLLKATDTVEASEALQRITRNLFDRDQLMKIATQKIGRLRRKDLERLRTEARADLEQPAVSKAQAAHGSTART
jgi:TBC1 domain family member 6